MGIKRAFAAIISLAIVFGCFGGAFGEVRLPSVISDNMVLQREQGILIWGWAEPEEEVTVAIGDNRASAKAGADGSWRVTLAAMKASAEPAEMEVSGEKSSKIMVKNILVGEVWLGSGQSNMEWPLINTTKGGEFVKEADFPDIRLLKVPHVLSATPADDVEVKWVVCTPETAKDFSAVLYHFGRNLRAESGVPIGLIDSSWGGSNIRTWIPPEGFASQPDLIGYSEWINWANDTRAKAKSLSLDEFEAFLEEIKKEAAESKDKPFWDKMTNEGYRNAVLDAHKMFASWLERARKAAAADEPLPDMPHPLQYTHIYNPTLLYNAMIHPLVPFGIRGAIWYQGESDCGAGMLYCHQMKGLVHGWRKVWNEGEFPFYYVQLAPYHYSTTFPHCKPGDLPLLWEAQTEALSVPNTGMVVTYDIGSVGDIHPRNKHDVGRRLALWALAGTYGRGDIVFSGPLYDSYEIEGGKIRIRFKCTGSGLVTRDGKAPTWFSIAGEDGKFVEATAEIEGDTVVVSSDKVSNPVAVRFGWDETAEPNLANKEGLPASSFRTDKW